MHICCISVPVSKNLVEGAIPGELWTRQGSVAAATLIGSIAQTNTCRITRPTLPVHIHTSGSSTVVPRNRRRRRRRRRRSKRRRREEEEEEEAGSASEDRPKKERDIMRKRRSGDRDKSVLSLISD